MVGVPAHERHKVFAWTERMMSNDDDDQGAMHADAQVAIR